MQIKERIDMSMKIKRLIAFFASCTLLCGATSFADDIEALQEDVVICSESEVSEVSEEDKTDNDVEILSTDIASTEAEIELLFEETYDFENYYMDGEKVTTSFDNTQGERMWQIRQETKSHILDVVPSTREGYGDMLRIATKSASGGLFYAQNNGSGNYLPEVTDGVVVFEYDFYLTKEAFPTFDSVLFAQFMTTDTKQYIFPYIIRRNGDNIAIGRNYSKPNEIAYSGVFPDKQWVKVRSAFDYTTGKWYSVFIEEDGATRMLANGSNIPDFIKTAGVRSTRISYTTSGNEEGKLVQLFADNYRYYKINNFSSSGVGYPGIKEIADVYSAKSKLNNNVYYVGSPMSVSENFSEYTTVPSALTYGNGEKWSKVAGGEYLGGVVNVVEKPDDSNEKALYFSSNKLNINQYADMWITPEKGGALCFDAKVRIEDIGVKTHIDFWMQGASKEKLTVLDISDGKLYLGDSVLTDIETDKWYDFNMLISEANSNVFLVVNDGENIVDANLAVPGIVFDNPARITLTNEYSENLSGKGVYYSDISLTAASDFVVRSKTIAEKEIFTVMPKLDFTFSNFVDSAEFKNINFKDVYGTDVPFEVAYTGGIVKNIVITPKENLTKNMEYVIDLSGIRDILGNSQTDAVFTIKTGDPAIMDILDVKKIELIDGGKKLEYIRKGNVTVNVDVTNITQDDTDAILLLMVYDGYTMTDIVKSGTLKLGAAESGILSADISIPASGSKYRLRACVWDSEENRFALTKSYVFDSTGMMVE